MTIVSIAHDTLVRWSRLPPNLVDGWYLPLSTNVPLSERQVAIGLRKGIRLRSLPSKQVGWRPMEFKGFWRSSLIRSISGYRCMSVALRNEYAPLFSKQTLDI